MRWASIPVGQSSLVHGSAARAGVSVIPNQKGPAAPETASDGSVVSRAPPWYQSVAPPEVSRGRVLAGVELYVMGRKTRLEQENSREQAQEPLGTQNQSLLATTAPAAAARGSIVHFWTSIVKVPDTLLSESYVAQSEPDTSVSVTSSTSTWPSVTTMFW